MHEHENESFLQSIFEVTFGLEHMISEFFWNAVFLLVGFAISRAVAWKKIHKYIDDKHEVKHEDGSY